MEHTGRDLCVCHTNFIAHAEPIIYGIGLHETSVTRLEGQEALFRVLALTSSSQAVSNG